MATGTFGWLAQECVSIAISLELAGRALAARVGCCAAIAFLTKVNATIAT